MHAFLTSCGRPDLLRRTLESMKGSERITRLTIHEDDPHATAPPFDWPGAEWVFTGGIGQHASIWRFIKDFSGQHYFHLEDDWQFTSGEALDKSIDASMQIMERHNDCVKVLNRVGSWHPCEHTETLPDGRKYGQIGPWHNDGIAWNGFSWNPGVTWAEKIVKAMSVGELVGEWTEHDTDSILNNWGYHTYELSPGIYRHIGDHQPTDRSNELRP